MGIFLLMCVVFAAYFGYDGLWGYPADNLKWAKQNLENISAEEQEGVQINPRVMMAEIRKVKPDMPVEAMKALLGEPAVVGQATDSPLGAEDYWYVGPAAFARIRVFGGKVREILRAEENKTHSEGDIYWQKVFGVGLSIVSLGVLIHFWRINRMRTILDDIGVTVKGQHVPWDRMTGVDTEDYQRKGWLDLVYTTPGGQEETVRLDSYHIEKFDEIVQEICQRKGYVCPIKPKEPDEADPVET